MKHKNYASSIVSSAAEVIVFFLVILAIIFVVTGCKGTTKIHGSTEAVTESSCSKEGGELYQSLSIKK